MPLNHAPTAANAGYPDSASPTPVVYAKSKKVWDVEIIGLGPPNPGGFRREHLEANRQIDSSSGHP
jgi:hypothetical protein